MHKKQTKHISHSCCFATFGPASLLFGLTHSDAISSIYPKEWLQPCCLFSSNSIWSEDNSTLNTALFFLIYSTLWHFLRRSGVCLETHKLFGHVIVGPLREYSHDSKARFVHGDALYQWVTGRAAALFRQLSEWYHRHADDAVLTGKAVVLYWDV